ncbi:MAG: iron-containing alcohol dehydrogenase [Christensenellaceae bacterium]|jgi:alcohol dehydrogenase class IV|nr:iron-containing alcohol dehydrogenase [Christensenellaceae bacterium]
MEQLKKEVSTKINLDIGVINRLDTKKFKNILVLTGPKNSLDIFKQKVEPHLKKGKYIVYSQISANPADGEVYLITNSVRDKNIDCIISVGGGSVMDCGRLVSLLLSHSGFLHDYVLGGSLGTGSITSNLIHHITIPTVCGTGAEISAISAVTINGRKQRIFSPYLVPEATYIDPELMKNIPVKLWAGIGFECFAGAIEAYTSTLSNVSSDNFALEALKEYVKTMPKILKEPNKVEYIKQMAIASLNSTMAVGMSSLGAIHAIGEALSGRLNLHTGIALAIVAPSVCEFNYEANKPKYDNLKEVFGYTKQRSIKAAVGEIINNTGVFVPKIKDKIKDILDDIVQDSMNHILLGNARPVKPEDILKILEKLG